MRVLDLFSGIGGFSLGLEQAGMETVAFCEQDEFCRKVLAKHWPDVPCHEDVRTLKGADVGPVDLICGGYPCQPVSQAGQRRGKDDDRWLWPEMFRLVEELRPNWVFGENVAGHISLGLDDVLSDLEGAGYACQAFVIPAVAVDAPHRRGRLWIIAAQNDPYTDSQRPHREGKHEQRGSEPADRQEREVGQVREVLAGRRNAGERRTEDVADANRPRQHSSSWRGQDHWDEQGNGARWSGENVPNPGQPGLPQPEQETVLGTGWRQEGRAVAERYRRKPESCLGGMADGFSPGLDGAGLMWPPEPEGIPRVATGVPNRVSRLKALGNAVVPQVVEAIGHAIMEASK